MWMLSFVPDAWLHLVVLGVLGLGAVIYILSYFTVFVPPLVPAKEAIRIIGTLIIVAGVFFYGSYDTEMTWRNRVAEAEAKIARAEAESKRINAKLKSALAGKVRVIHDTQVVFRDRVRQDAAKIDAECKLDPIVIEDLNQAAGGKKK
jgi:hypothetical protein